MRIVIDIVGNDVRVQRVEAEDLPPADVLARAAASGAMNAGAARLPGATPATEGEVVASDARARVADAGRAPKEPARRAGAKAATSSGRKRNRAKAGPKRRQ